MSIPAVHCSLVLQFYKGFDPPSWTRELEKRQPTQAGLVSRSQNPTPTNRTSCLQSCPPPKNFALHEDLGYPLSIPEINPKLPGLTPCLLYSGPTHA